MNQVAVRVVRLPGILSSNLAGAVGKSLESGQRQQRLDFFEALLARSNRSLSADKQEWLLDGDEPLDKRDR